MVLFRLITFIILFGASRAFGGVGLSGGVGVPFLGQVGVDYKASSQWSFYAGYNLLDISVGSASAELSMPEVLVRFHPFSQSFFIGLGVGSENLDVSAVDDLTATTARAEVSAMTGIAKLGWMWGAADNQGVWIGVDVAYIMPFNADVTITAPGIPVTDPDYQDVVEAADRFGETGYLNVTFLRLGYLF